MKTKFCVRVDMLAFPLNSIGKQLVHILLCLCLVFPTGLYAQTDIQIAIPEIDIPRNVLDQRGQLKSSLIEAFNGVPSVVLTSLQKISLWQKKYQGIGSSEASSSESELQEFRSFLIQGKQHYGEMKYAKAIEPLKKARTGFIQKLNLLRSNKDLLEAHLYLGMAYTNLNQQEEGYKEFKRVIYLDSNHSLSSSDYSPPIVDAFNKAKQEIEQTPSVVLRIDSNEVGQVYINGKNSGNTPLELSVRPGEYFVLVEKSGMKPWYNLVNVQKRLENVRAILEPNTNILQWAHLFRVREGEDQQSQDVTSMVDFGHFVRADFVVLSSLVYSTQYRLMGQLLNVKTGEFSNVAIITIGSELDQFFSFAQELAQTLLGFIRSDGNLITSKNPSISPNEGDLTVGKMDRPVPEVSVSPIPEKQWYERWWIYPLLIAAGVGVFLGARQIGGSGGSKVIIDNSNNY